VLLMVGVLSVGVSACGSSKSSSSKSSPTVVKKEAGHYKDVQFTVYHRSTSTVNVWMCDPPASGVSNWTGPCPQFRGYALAPGKTAYRTQSTVTGELTY
jgi:hypothetical protein